MAPYLISTETHSEIQDEHMKRTKKDKNAYSQTSRLAKPEVLQLHNNHEKNLVLNFAFCSLINAKRIISDK
jgi:hypothetical protein